MLFTTALLKSEVVPAEVVSGGESCVAYSVQCGFLSVFVQQCTP